MMQAQPASGELRHTSSFLLGRGGKWKPSPVRMEAGGGGGGGAMHEI